jgi:succinate dehydrogenase / fumarate reductase cytochrome b subunit
VMVAFVVAHVIGNLLVFVGPGALNHYSAVLKANAPLLWFARSVLLASGVAHVVCALQLTRHQVDVRPVGYARYEPQAAGIASRSMRWGGVFLFTFIVLHLLHFTTRTFQPVPLSATDVYANVVTSFRVWWVSALYLVAMVALGLHLYHGTWSVFQTLGLNHPNYNPARRRFATALAILVYLGFTSIPIAVMAGLLR